MDILLKSITDFTFLSILFLLLLFYIAYWYLSIPKNLPPGPLGLPLLGYLPFLGRQPYDTFVELGNKYGPIYR